MKARWLLALAGLAALGWAANRPLAPWGEDWDAALARSRPVVVLVADPARPLAPALLEAIDQAWRALRPRAERVRLLRADPRTGSSSALAVSVHSAQGQLVARRDGHLSPELAQEWLGRAIAAAESAPVRAERGRTDPAVAFENAGLAMELGALDAAQQAFLALTSCEEPRLRAQAWERLARLSAERGEVAQARAHLALATALASEPDARANAQLALTRGLIELAEREHLAACGSFEEAAQLFTQLGDPLAERARYERARALSARGADGLAIEALDALARDSISRELRESARSLADSLRVPPPPH